MTGTRGSVAERLTRHIDITSDGCWLWTGSLDAAGYGRIYLGPEVGRPGLAHRASYEMAVGPVPDGLVLDHLCRVRRCVNPAHLEPVTHRENVLRGEAPNIVLHRLGVCARGHDLATEASRRRSTGAVVYCRACRREDRRAP